jgi:hypothetical protein
MRTRYRRSSFLEMCEKCAERNSSARLSRHFVRFHLLIFVVDKPDLASGQNLDPCHGEIARAIKSAKMIVAIRAEGTFKHATDDSEGGRNHQPLRAFLVESRRNMLRAFVEIMSGFCRCTFGEIFWPKRFSAPAACRTSTDGLDISSFYDGHAHARNGFVPPRFRSRIGLLSGHGDLLFARRRLRSACRR